MPSLLLFARDYRLSYGPSLQTAHYVTSGADTATVTMLAISISRKIEFSRRFSSKATKPLAIGVSQK